jgi:hypothetical protein
LAGSRQSQIYNYYLVNFDQPSAPEKRTLENGGIRKNPQLKFLSVLASPLTGGAYSYISTISKPAAS